MILDEIQSSEFHEKQNSFDFASQIVIQSHKKCENCFGNIDYLQKDDKLSTGNCEYFMFRKEDLKECIKCQIQGCQNCISTIQCIESFQKLDDQCYLKKNICSNQQLYDTNLAKCIYSCRNNYVEEQIQQICSNFNAHQAMFREDYSGEEQIIVNYLEFSNFHYVIYNHISRTISLFKKNQFKDSINMVTSEFRVLKLVKLIKTGSDKLLFNYKNFIIFAQVNITNSKIIQIYQEYVSIQIKEIYFFQDEIKQLILIIEDQTNTIFEINLESILQNKKIRINQINQDLSSNEYFRYAILNNFILFYSKNTLNTYNINLKQLTVIQIKISEIALIFKSESLNHSKSEINMKKESEREEGYLINQTVSYVQDYILDSLLLIINSYENKIKIFNLNRQIIETEISINYVIQNIYIEIERRFIFIVGNLGNSYIYTYDLKLLNQISNSCLHQTKILADDFYLYSFCARQVDIYDRQTLERIYPRIKFKQQSLNRIIYAKQKNTFILVSNENMQVVKFLEQQNTFQIIFQKDKYNLIVVNWQIVDEVNLIKQLEITAIFVKGTVNYKISLEQLQIDTFKFKSTNLQSFNNYIPINIENYALSQLSNQRRITHDNQISFYEPNLYNNTFEQSINNKDSAQKDKEEFLLWTEESIIDYNNQKNQILEIKEFSLSTQGSKQIILNEKKNMKQIIFEKIKFLNIQQQIVLMNFELVILKDIVLDNYIDQYNLTSIISIINCNTTEISNLNIINNNSSLNNQNSIFLLNKLQEVKIQNVTIQNSIINYSLFQINLVNNVLIDNVFVNHTQLQRHLLKVVGYQVNKAYNNETLYQVKIQNITTLNSFVNTFFQIQQVLNISIDNIFINYTQAQKPFFQIEGEKCQPYFTIRKYQIKIQNITILYSFIHILYQSQYQQLTQINNVFVNHTQLEKYLISVNDTEPPAGAGFICHTNFQLQNLLLQNITQLYYLKDNDVYTDNSKYGPYLVQKRLFDDQNSIIQLETVDHLKISEISIRNSNISTFFSTYHSRQALGNYFIENITSINTQLQKSLIQVLQAQNLTIQNVDIQNIYQGDFFSYNNSTSIQIQKNEYNSIIALHKMATSYTIADFKNIKIQNSIISTLFYAQNFISIILQNFDIIGCSQINKQNSIISLNGENNSNKINFRTISVRNSNISTLFKYYDSKDLSLTDFAAKDIQLQNNLFDIFNIQSIQLSKLDIKNITGGNIIMQQGCKYVKYLDITLEGLQNQIILKQIPIITPIKEVIEIFNLTIQNFFVSDSKNIQTSIKSKNVSIENAIFENISEQDGYIIDFQTQQLSMNFCQFTKISSNNKNSAIIMIQNVNKISSEGTIFEKNKIQLIQIIGQIKSNIENQEIGFILFNDLYVLNNQCNTSLIQIQNSRNLTVINSTFKGNKSFLSGGGLYLAEIDNIKFKNSTFESNKSEKQQGGAIYFKWSPINQKQSFNLSECSFINNEALFGKGGALFISNVDFQIENTIIQQNKALIGGGIFYEIIIPNQIEKNQIKNLNAINKNTAIIYGNNIGSTLRDMKFMPQNLINTDYSFDNDQEKSILIKNFQSGTYLSLDKINFIDEEGNEFLANFTQFSSDEIQNELDKIRISNESTEITFEGESVSKYRDNGFKFDKIYLQYFPNQIAEFFLTSSIINGLLYSDRSNIYIPERRLKLKFLVNFRECVIGEIQKDVQKQKICEKCPDGKYSINLKDSVCQICPFTAIRCQGNQIILKEGYWRKSNNTDIIIPCTNNYKSCKPEDPFSKYGCLEGYIGPLCESCDINGNVWNDRYSFKIASSQCTKCSQNNVFIILSAIIFYIFQFVMISFALSRIFNQVSISLYVYYLKLGGILYLSKSEYIYKNPVYQKILTDHLQIISIVRSFQIQIPSSFNSVVDTVGNPFEISSTSFDCIFDFQKFSFIPIWVFKFIQQIIIPIALIASYILYQKLKTLFKFDHIHSRYYVTVIIYIYFHFFPSMISLIIKSLNCRLIGEEYFSQSDLNIKCDSFEQRGKYLYFFIIPFSSIFVILLPICLFIKIRNLIVFKKQKITQSRFKFVFDSFKDSLYFWDMTRLGYKSMIMVVSMILQQYPIIKISIINIILSLFFQIQFKLQPYKSHFYNQLESRSSKICIFTINMCLFYLLTNPLNQILSQLTLILMYLFNSFFILELIYLIFKEPIPADKYQRSCFQKLLVKLKMKLPNLLKFIKIQHKINMKSLFKFKTMKSYLKILSRFKIQTQFDDDIQFSAKLQSFILKEKQKQESYLPLNRQVQVQPLQQSRQLQQELSILESRKYLELSQQQTPLKQIQISEQLQTYEQTSAIIRSSDLNSFISFNDIININEIK